MKRVIVYFGDEKQKQPIVEQVLKELQMDYRIIPDDLLNQRVAALFHLPGYDEIPDTAPAHHSIDLMLFEEASDEDIQVLNERLQANGTAMQRKAMLTQHNKRWKFSDLLSEIEREHTYFQIMDALRPLLVQSSELVIEAYTPASWKSYEQAFYQAYACMNKECSLEEITAAYKALSSAKKQLIPAG